MNGHSLTGMATKNLVPPSPAELSSWSDRKLDSAIKRGHTVAGAHMRNFENAARYTGAVLIERKHRLKHGAWLPWLEKHFDGHRDTAATYMKLAAQMSEPSDISTADQATTETDAEPTFELTDEQAEYIEAMKAENLAKHAEAEQADRASARERKTAEDARRMDREFEAAIHPDTPDGNAARKAEALLKKAADTFGTPESEPFALKAIELIQRHKLDVMVTVS